MAGLAIAAVVASLALLVFMFAVLVSLRRGEGPTVRASRLYDANRREAVRILLGEPVDRIDGAQWYDPRRRTPSPDDPAASSFGDAVADALAAVVPGERGLRREDDGSMSLTAEQAWVVPALSTADLRQAGIERWDDRGRLTIGLVLFNPEPPGADARRVVLPVQVLFPALARAGRADLIRLFESLRERAATRPREAR